MRLANWAPLSKLGFFRTACIVAVYCAATAISSPAQTLTTPSFDGTDGVNPDARLVQATDGNLLGTTDEGRTNRQGPVFRLPPGAPIQFVPATPCRVVDTSNPNGPFGGPAISRATARSFPLAQSGNPCNIPSNAVAYSLNVSVAPQLTLRYLTIWPTGEIQPLVSTMNSVDGRIKGNAAIVPAGVPSGSVSVYVTDTTNVMLDIDGYFTAPGSETLQFYPLPPCRLVDTRGSDGPLGGPFLQGGFARDFPVLESTCIPTGLNPTAYSLNFTVVPYQEQPLGYLTVWPTGESQPTTTTLNNPTATIVANAAIVTAGTGGAIEVYVDNSTNLIFDINGYFAPAGTGGLSLYPVAPCRVLDTRSNNGQAFQGEKTVNVVGSVCAPPANAQAYVFNATVVPPGPLGYLTLWPNGGSQPVVSTLNADDGFITSNMAIVPTTNGSIDAYANDLTQLILDISGYFAP